MLNPRGRGLLVAFLLSDGRRWGRTHVHGEEASCSSVLQFTPSTNDVCCVFLLGTYIQVEYEAFSIRLSPSKTQLLMLYQVLRYV